jgi:CRISPR-associated protein Csh2
MSNPNGDPDENKPRFDSETNKIYVTEFRLKRTIRKYLKEVMKGHNILLRQEVDEELEKEQGEESFKMLDKLAGGYIFYVDGRKNKNKKKKRIPKIKQNELLANHIDIRLFGVMFVVGKENFSRFQSAEEVIDAGLNFKQVGHYSNRHDFTSS